MNSILSVIILLGLLIFVHELGHFMVAKLCGVKVLKFSLGFGPKIYGKQYGETEYLLSAFPLGGYVKMLGEQPDEEPELADLKRSFSLKPLWQRFLIVGIGPIANILFAILISFILFAVTGRPEIKDVPIVGEITLESPAEIAGLQVDDAIISIDGKLIEKWQDISPAIQERGDGPVKIKINRQDKNIVITCFPKKNEIKNIWGEVVEQRFLIGIGPKLEMRKIGLGASLSAGIQQTWYDTFLIIEGMKRIIQRKIPASELGGPILIAQLAGQSMEAGLASFFRLMALISVNLGILNLLPVPVLDGGHLSMYLVEAIRRKPLSMRTKEILQTVGLFLLGSLMIFVFYNDIVRLISKS